MSKENKNIKKEILEIIKELIIKYFDYEYEDNEEMKLVLVEMKKSTK